jgi:hypothetical protein
LSRIQTTSTSGPAASAEEGIGSFDVSSAGEREGDPTYDLLMDRLRATHPRLARQLVAAQRTRTVRAALLADGVRFLGLEELLSKLDQIAVAWGRDSKLGRIAFLVRRAVADFETAIEAAVSGYPAVGSDSMRDIMEMELLLLDFFNDPDQIEVWLSAEQRTRRQKFSPGAVRSRVIATGLHEIVRDERVAIDYRAHSEAQTS